MSFVTDLLDKWYDEIPRAEDLGYLNSTVFILRYAERGAIVFLGEEGGWLKTTNDVLISDVEEFR